jgi:hypothetical protein
MTAPSALFIRASAVETVSEAVETVSEAAGQILDELPGDAARPGAASGRPFERLGPQIVTCDISP